METTSQRVCEIIAGVFNLPTDDVTEAASYETIEAWDSMGQLMLILELEQEFNRQFPPELVETMTNVKTIVTVIDTGE